MNTSTRSLFACLAAISFSLTACSSDGSNNDTDSPSVNEAPSSDSGADTGSAETGSGTGGDFDVPPEATMNAVESAMGADKVELEGTVIHVYLGDDNTKVPKGTECMILNSVTPDGYTAVAHRGGAETPC